jgi:RHS repeat-associated protein
MSRKTRPENRSTVKKSAARPSISFVARFDLRTKVIACVILASLIAGVTYASWLPSKSDEPVSDTAGFSRNDVKSPVKNVSTLSQDELAAIPPEALRPHRPEPPGYNASQGGLPPGALPPGVVLPGITDAGRTMAQGYGMYDGVRHQFTGKERDGETGLDYFGARYYSSAQGRFTSPDELQSTSEKFILLGKGHPTKQALPNADLTNPQSLNKYHYALNNPLRYVDPDGQEPQDSAEIKMQQAIKDLNSGRITEQQYWERLRGGAVGAGVGVGVIVAGRMIIAAPSAVTSLLLWASRNPNTVQQLSQDAIQMSTGSPAPANRLSPNQIEQMGTSIARDVMSMGRGQMAGIAARVTERGVSQAEAVGVVQTAILNVGKNSVAVQQANGTVIVASVVTGTNKPVLIVNQQGIVSQGRATIDAGVRKGKAFFEVKDVVSK